MLIYDVWPLPSSRAYARINLHHWNLRLKVHPQCTLLSLCYFWTQNLAQTKLVDIHRVDAHRVGLAEVGLDNSTSLSGFSTTLATTTVVPEPTATPSNAATTNSLRRANATLVMLCRNEDLAGVISSIWQLETVFNRNHGYPWILLNDEPFTDHFKKYDLISCLDVVIKVEQTST